MTSPLKETTIRDFGGGWDVSDSDKNLTSKYQPISDNIIRLTDGSIRIRPGTILFGDLRQGTTATVAAASYTVATTNASGVIKITKNAHGYTTGQHIIITSWSTTINNITSAMMVGVSYGINVNDANNFSIYTRNNANATGTGAVTIGWTYDTNMLSSGASDIFGKYYKDNIIIFADDGEIFAVNSAGTPSVVWSYSKAAALTLQPWGPCKRVSAEVVRGHLLAVNGSLNDKPLDINGTTANYLIDPPAPSAGNNLKVPRSDFIIAADRYVLMIATENGATLVQITAKDTVSTFTGATYSGATEDAPVDIDLGMMTQSVESTILGANVIRSKVFVAFHDRSQLMTLGDVSTGTTPKHVPDVKDVVAQFGAFAHASIVSLGNDIFCAGLNGVNSLEISRASGDYVPATVSDLIHPVMLRHLTRLTEDDRRYKTFAVWDTATRQYMLFAPKYSNITDTLPEDPVIASSTSQPFNIMYLQYPSHSVDAGDYVDIAGATNSGTLLGSMVNGRRKIKAIIDSDTIAVITDPYPANTNVSFGGLAVTVTPVNDETPAYVYEYNPRLKIRRWTRYKGLNYRWGAISQLNKLFFSNGSGRIYRMGGSNDKYYADYLGDYTKRGWFNNTAYAVNDRVLDTTNKKTYLCLVAHTSPSTGTFKQYRDNPANHGVWEEFQGIPITWEVESGWTDFKERVVNKQIELVRFDTTGSSEFEFSLFTNSIRTDFDSFELIPRRTAVWIGQDAPGFGAGTQPYGGGRNTRQEWLRGMPVEGKLFKMRFAGQSVDPLTIASVTLYYHNLPRALT